jgi:hypothetical protein
MAALHTANYKDRTITFVVVSIKTEGSLRLSRED